MQIDKHVPIPCGLTRHTYPFADMQVGDSFALPKAQANNVRTAAMRYQKRTPNWGYVTRIDDNVVRIWRTK